MESIKKAQMRRNAIDSVKAFMKSYPEITGEELVLETMSRMNVARRTAQEYILVADAEIRRKVTGQVTRTVQDNMRERIEKEDAEMKKGWGDVKEVDETE